MRRSWSGIADNMMTKRITTRMIVLLGLLAALEIVLSRFLSITLWNLKIGFSFVPIVVAALLFGPVPAGIMAAVADVIGATLFPVFTFFPGFTLSAFLTGAVFGLFLYRRQGWPRLLAAVAVNVLLLGLLLNSGWISILYGSPYLPLLGTRIFLECAVMGPVQFLVSAGIIQALKRGKFLPDAA